MSSVSQVDECQSGSIFLTARGFQCVLLLHIICSLIAIVANVTYLWKIFPKIYFHYNIKILIVASILMNCAHSVLYVGLQSTHLYRYLTTINSCDLFFHQSFCFLFRYPAMISMFSFVILNGAIAVERFLATCYLKDYEVRSRLYGHLICFTAVLISFLLPWTSISLTPWSEKTPYCNSVTKYSANAVSITSYCMLALDAIILLAYYLINRLNELKKKRITYNLASSYQIRENSVVFQLLMPWMIFHFVLFAFFYIANAVIPSINVVTADPMFQRTIFAIVYIVPEYCALSPLLLWKVYRIQERERLRTVQMMMNMKPTGEAYFRGYLWSTPPHYEHIPKKT